MTPRGNTLVITLLGLTVAAIVGLCFAPLQLRTCGHLSSLVDRWLPHWKAHKCHGMALNSDLRVIHETLETYQKEHGHLEKTLFEMVPSDGLSDDYTWGRNYQFTYTRHGSAQGYRISIERTPSLPGWYLMTSDGNLHFSEKAPATEKDVVLEQFGGPVAW